MAGLIKKAMSANEPEDGETVAHEGAESADMEATEDASGEDPGEAGGQEGGEGPGESNDEGYKAAQALLMDILYKQGGAKKVAQALKGSQNPAEAMANLTYDMVMAVDEKTQGAISDDDIVTFAAGALGEVADIAEAAGVAVNGKMVTEAMRTMMLRYAQDNGVETSKIQQAMGQVNTDEVGAAMDQQVGQGAA